MPKHTTKQLSAKLCKCGCGQQVPLAKYPCEQCLYIQGHPRRRPVQERFWKNVQKNDTDQCWIWTGSFHETGYGTLFVINTNKKAHRLSWEIHFGPIPDGLFCLHKCDNRQCVNPEHLFLGTNNDNMKDMVKKNRQALHNGSSNGRAKLSEADITAIRQLSKKEYHPSKLAETYHMSKSQISRIRNYRAWKVE